MSYWYASEDGDEGVNGEVRQIWTWRPRLQVNKTWSVGLDLYFTSREACELFIREELINPEGPKDARLAGQ